MTTVMIITEHALRISPCAKVCFKSRCSKYGPQTSNTGISWELVRNADSRVPAQTYGPHLPGDGSFQALQQSGKSRQIGFWQMRAARLGRDTGGKEQRRKCTAVTDGGLGGESRATSPMLQGGWILPDRRKTEKETLSSIVC